MRTVLMILFSTYHNDSRVTRMATTLSKKYPVVIFARLDDGLPAFEEFSGVKVYRYSMGKWLPRGKLWRVFSYLGLSIKYVAGSLRIKSRFVHSHDLAPLPIGWLIARLAGAQLIYDAHEMWSEQQFQKKMPIAFRVAGSCVEKKFSKKADAVLTVSDGIANLMQQRYNLQSVKVIRNVSVREYIDRDNSVLRDRLRIDPREFVVLYQGSLSAGRGLDVLIDAFERVVSAGCQLVLLGDGPLKESLASGVALKGLSRNVHFVSAVPLVELPYWTVGADVGVHPMVGSCINHELALPNKLFEYLQAGLPVIVSDMPEMANFVRENKVGLTFMDGSSEELAERIVQLTGDLALREKMRVAAESVGSVEHWGNESKKLLALYSDLATRSVI